MISMYFFVGSFFILFQCKSSLSNIHPPLSMPFQSVVHPYPKPEHFLSLKNHQDHAFPTGAWWLNLVMDQGDSLVGLMPYTIQATSQALHLCYPFRVVQTTDIVLGFSSQLIFSSDDIVNRQVIDYDDLSVTLRFSTLSNTSYFIAYLVRGSPYITLEFHQLKPRIQSYATISIVKEEENEEQNILDNSILLQLGNGQQWKLYSDVSISSMKMSSSQTELQFMNPMTMTLRIAHVPNSKALQVLDQYASTSVVGGHISYTFSNHQALLQFHWKVQGNGKALMLALPHHVDTLVNAKVVLSNMYFAMKGPMTALVGNQWNMKENMTNIQWTSKQKLYPNSKSKILQALQNDILTLPTADDSYTFGKQIARHARLALIAEELGMKELLNPIITSMKSALEPWLLGTNANSLVYDTTWGGICTKNGIKDKNADYGNGYYNDHHFHYGYFIYALAVVGKIDPHFLETHQAAVLGIYNDIGCLDKTNRFFPFVRHKDWYDGHSWASGLFSIATGKAQESSSESVNAYYAISLLGLAMGNNEMYQGGCLLLSMELRSVRRYWHMQSHDRIYEPKFAKGKMVGVVSALKVSQTTWFGVHLEYVHGVNMLPFTPITEELLDHEWVQQEYQVLQQVLDRQNPPIEQAWESFVYLDHAILDPLAAWKELNTISIFDNGNSKTNSLYWIATRPMKNPSKFKTIIENPNQQCFGFPLCAKAGIHNTPLLCCSSFPGCCNGDVLIDCCQADSCANQPLCATAGPNGTSLACCNTKKGCCPGLGCCIEPKNKQYSQSQSPKQPPQKTTSTTTSSSSSSTTTTTSISSNTCHNQPMCATAGLNGTSLECCNSKKGCCPGLECCIMMDTTVARIHPSNTSRRNKQKSNRTQFSSGITLDNSMHVIQISSHIIQISSHIKWTVSFVMIIFIPLLAFIVKNKVSSYLRSRNYMSIRD